MIFIPIIVVILLIFYVCTDIHNTFYHKPQLINIYSNKLTLSNTKSKTPYKFYTFYSEKYKPTYDLMIKTVKDDFDIHPIVVKQNEMNSCFGRSPKTIYDYRWRGCDIKIELIKNCIKQNMGKYIVFADSDLLFIKPVGGILDYYKENAYDLVVTEGCLAKVGNDYCITTGGNIGILFIKCSDKTLTFFEKIQKTVNENEWDEGVLKKHLEITTELKHARFPAYLVSTQFAYNQQSHVVKIVGSYIKIDKNKMQKEILSKM